MEVKADSKRIKRWLELEQRLVAAAQDPERLGKLERKNGSGVLWSSPSGVDQTRMGRLRPRVPYTASLARLLAHDGGGCLALWGPAQGDPNWDDVHPLKTALSELAPGYGLVVDLHGMGDEHGVDLCVALGNQPARESLTLARRLSVLAQANGLSLSINHPYNASRPSTIPSFLDARSLPAFQLYLARRVCRPDLDPASATRLVATLAALQAALSSTAEAEALEPVAAALAEPALA